MLAPTIRAPDSQPPAFRPAGGGWVSGEREDLSVRRTLDPERIQFLISAFLKHMHRIWRQLETTLRDRNSFWQTDCVLRPSPAVELDVPIGTSREPPRPGPLLRAPGASIDPRLPRR